MANTERLRAIQFVREAREAVGSARFDSALSVEERQKLEQANIELNNLEGELILREIRERVDALTNDCARLEALAKDMKQSAEKLKAIAEMIEKAAKAVAVLVEIASKASGAGLIG